MVSKVIIQYLSNFCVIVIYEKDIKSASFKVKLTDVVKRRVESFKRVIDINLSYKGKCQADIHVIYIVTHYFPIGKSNLIFHLLE